MEFGGLDDDDIREPAETVDARPATVPLFRVADAGAELPPAPAQVEPLEQLRRIETALSEIDDGGDFLPAGSIGPEVELVFPDPGNPFSEPFEEEVVVVDRYAAQARSSMPAAPACSPAAPDTTSPAAAVARGAALRPDLATLPMCAETAEPPAGDADLLTVEDNYDDVPPPRPRPVIPVRHLEYRRLFARLRHG